MYNVCEKVMVDWSETFKSCIPSSYSKTLESVRGVFFCDGKVVVYGLTFYAVLDLTIVIIVFLLRLIIRN